jgi:hypothetical protein
VAGSGEKLNGSMESIMVQTDTRSGRGGWKADGRRSYYVVKLGWGIQTDTAFLLCLSFYSVQNK